MIHTVPLIKWNGDFIGFLRSNKQRFCNNLRFKNTMLWKFWRIRIQFFSNKCLIDVTRSWQRNKNWRNSSSPIYIQSFPWIEYNIKNRIYALAYRVYGWFVDGRIYYLYWVVQKHPPLTLRFPSTIEMSRGKPKPEHGNSFFISCAPCVLCVRFV